MVAAHHTCPALSPAGAGAARAPAEARRAKGARRSRAGARPEPETMGRAAPRGNITRAPLIYPRAPEWPTFWPARRSLLTLGPPSTTSGARRQLIAARAAHLCSLVVLGAGVRAGQPASQPLVLGLVSGRQGSSGGHLSGRARSAPIGMGAAYFNWRQGPFGWRRRRPTEWPFNSFHIVNLLS